MAIKHCSNLSAVHSRESHSHNKYFTALLRPRLNVSQADAQMDEEKQWASSHLIWCQRTGDDCFLFSLVCGIRGERCSQIQDFHQFPPLSVLIASDRRRGCSHRSRVSASSERQLQRISKDSKVCQISPGHYSDTMSVRLVNRFFSLGGRNLMMTE